MHETAFHQNRSRNPIIICTILAETSPQAVPLGAACIISALRRSGFPAELRSFSAEDFQQDKSSCSSKIAAGLLAACSADEVPVIGFSLYVWNRLVLEETARLIRKERPEAILFAGGPEVTALPEVIAKENLFDYLITGEGEQTAVGLLTGLQESPGGISRGDLSPSPKSPSIKTKILAGISSPSMEELSSPWLDGTLDPRDYGGALWELSRGCPFSCTYCYESKGERKVRHFPASRIEAELDLFARAEIPQIFVLDPAFNADKERALLILALIEQKLPDTHFCFEIRSEFLDKTLSEAFTHIPCSLQIGLQSADPEVLKNVGRNFNRKEFSRKIALLNEAGAVFGLDLIYGLPGDSLATFRSSLDYAIGLYPNHLDIFRLSVLPGTVLAADAPRFGIDAEQSPPYHVKRTPKFSAADLTEAEKLAAACALFYSAGRAVPWFLSVLHLLKMQPSRFLSDFAAWNRSRGTLPHKEIQKLQLQFLKEKFREKKLSHLWTVTEEIILLHGAFSRAAGEGQEEILDLSWHPEDLFMAQDIAAFASEAYMEKTRVRIVAGPDMEIL
ncbi:MAG: radical SAM protein [Spirochaetaceae bacterium]|jgi:hypothetical protein|nr:radical SAM protein [Spirochaetaceae bacterium]